MKDSPVPKFDVTLTHEDADEIDLTLKVYRDGRCVLQESDRGEPEDQSFYRDWSWVPDAIRDAYAYGLEDGQADVHMKLRFASAELHDAWTAIAPVMMACQSSGAHTLMLEIIKKVEAAVKETDQPQLCDADPKSLSKPALLSNQQVAWLQEKMKTERGRWELLNPGACYDCSTPSGTTHHDYDRGCPQMEKI